MVVCINISPEFSDDRPIINPATKSTIMVVNALAVIYAELSLSANKKLCMDCTNLSPNEKKSTSERNLIESIAKI